MQISVNKCELLIVKFAARFQVALGQSQASSVQVGQMMKMPWQPATHTIALSVNVRPLSSRLSHHTRPTHLKKNKHAKPYRFSFFLGLFLLLDLTIFLNNLAFFIYRNHGDFIGASFFSPPFLCLTFLPRPAAAQLSCQLSVRDLSSVSSAVDAASVTLDPENCPYCAKALANESEGGTDGKEMAGDSDSDGVYEFTQDLHHKDRRDSRQPRRKRLRLGKTAANVVRFWRLVCDTFRKIVDSKYFGRGIMIAILINTLSMGIEYHEQVSQHERLSLHLVQCSMCLPALLSLN